MVNDEEPEKKPEEGNGGEEAALEKKAEKLEEKQ